MNIRNQIADIVRYVRNNFGVSITRSYSPTRLSSSEEYSLQDIIDFAKESGIEQSDLVVRAMYYRDYDNYDVAAVSLEIDEPVSDDAYFSDAVCELLCFVGIDREYTEYIRLKSKFENA